MNRREPPQDFYKRRKSCVIARERVSRSPERSEGDRNELT